MLPHLTSLNLILSYFQTLENHKNAKKSLLCLASALCMGHFFHDEIFFLFSLLLHTCRGCEALLRHTLSKKHIFFQNLYSIYQVRGLMFTQQRSYLNFTGSCLLFCFIVEFSCLPLLSGQKELQACVCGPYSLDSGMVGTPHQDVGPRMFAVQLPFAMIQ